MAKLHTDREILQAIFDMYRADYPAKGDPWLPIDVRAVASRLGTEPELLFGRLHFDMGARFKKADPGNSKTLLASIFEVNVGDKHHAVNFPYLTATLAGMVEQHRRNQWSLWISIGAIVVAVGTALGKFLGVIVG